MPRFVISRRATTKAHTAAEVRGLVAHHGCTVVRSSDDAVLVDGQAKQTQALAKKLRGWVVAPEREYGYPRRNPALRNAKKAFR